MMLFFLPPAKAQYYQTVYPDRIAYFENAGGNIKCIQIDSVWNFDEMVTYHFFRNIQIIDYDCTGQVFESGCITPRGPSWIGLAMSVSPNLNSFWLHCHNKVVYIKTNAQQDESWMAFDLLDSTKVVARVIDIDTLTFLGLTDSVKTIGLQAYTRKMIPKDHAVNNMTIRISKHYGFIRTLNFFLFPDIPFGFHNEILEEYNLIGLSEPQTGIQNLTWFEVYDFQVGDEIHQSSYSDFSMCWGDDYTSKTIDRYISRSDFPDSIVYGIDREQSYLQTYPKLKGEYFHDTIQVVIKPNPLFDKLPGDPIIQEYEAYAYTMHNGEFLSKTDASAYEVIWPGEDTCWSDCCYDGGFCNNTFIKGLGGPYTSCYDYFMCYGSSSNDLVYFKKGEKTWGTPLVISDIPDVGINRGIEIYPNPVIEKLWLKIPSALLPAAFELIDLSGKTVMFKAIIAENTSLKLEKALRGIYIYRIINDKTMIHQGKIVVE